MAGRPTKYEARFADQAKAHCLLGATNENLAALFDVTVSTIGLWMVKHRPFSDAIKAGREEADNAVAKSLYQRAMGYEHPEEVIMSYQGAVVRAETVKKYAPDPTSMIFWLKNRRPDLWRDRVEHTGKDGDSIVIEFR